jgi:hypothetical protein
MTTHTKAMQAVLIVGLSCGPASHAVHFCAEWASLNDQARRARVYAMADDYLATHPSRALADSLRGCVRERTDDFLKDATRYYICDSGDDFTAGKILGQAQGTGLALCLQQLRTSSAP